MFEDLFEITKFLARSDFEFFWPLVYQELEPGKELLTNWHLRLLAYELMLVERGESKRLIINVPPRSMKSLLASVALPSFLLGRDPTRRIMCVSYAERLAREFSVQTRTVMQSAWYRDLYPETVLAARRPPQLEFTTTVHGKRYASGFGGSLTGHGADFIICDDPMKAMDALSEKARQRTNDFFDNTLATRLNNKKTGAIIILMQRLHENDLVGHLIAQGDWRVVSLPAIAVEDETFRLSDWPDDVYYRKAGEILHPGREGPVELERARKIMGSWSFESQYQQKPVPMSGNLIKREWLRYYDDPPDTNDECLFIASWDTASTIGQNSDWSVGTVWMKIGTDFYLFDVERGRYETPELRRRIIDLHEYYKLDVTIIENTELGRALEQDIRQLRKIKVQLSKPKFDKDARISLQSVKFENGQVFLLKDAKWLDTYVNELIAFPNGKDDQVDSTSQALHWLSERGANTPQMLNVKVRSLRTSAGRGPDPYDILRSR